MSIASSSAFSPLGTDLFGELVPPRTQGPLAQKFTFPPFSVLNARVGEWQERKRAWMALGIRSELGRGYNALNLSGACEEKWQNCRLTWVNGSRPYSSLDETSRKILAVGHAKDFGTEGNVSNYTGTSIFDPVLAELCYRWFCPPGGQIVDPFAGGSVRGIVAGLLGYRYFGIDLSAAQIAANEEQKAAICPQASIEWLNGDCTECLERAPEADFVFTCPPYGDLEVYSDDPRDLSTMDYHAFIAAIGRIALRCHQKLKPDGMACWVVGDFRDPKTGCYRGFVADTISVFRQSGFGLLNEAILVTMVGSLPLRVSAQFEKSKKLGKTHQNVLVFKKVRQ